METKRTQNAEWIRRRMEGRKPFSQWHFQEKMCRTCGAVFLPIAGPQKECPKCRLLTAKRLDRASHLRRRKIKLDALPLLQCWYCGESFKPTSFLPQVACGACRGGATLKAKGGQSDKYRVKGMLVAEFAFFTIMQQLGIALEYIGQNGAWFKLNGTHFRPDFRVPQTNVYYEVIGSRQRLHQARHKHQQFRALYPDLKLIVVRPDGTELHEDR